MSVMDVRPHARIPAPSATLAANETLERRRLTGAPTLSLALGEAGLPIHPALRRELAAGAALNGYGPVAGSAELRAAVAGYWARRGIDADPEFIVCGPGSKPLLYALLLAIGGDVVIPRPSWVSYASQIRLNGFEPIFVAALSSEEGGVPDPAQMAAAVTRARSAGRDVRCAVVTIPDNPTGTVASRRTVARFCEVARELDLLVISDQIYRDLVFDDAAPFPCPARIAPERTVITTSPSKNLAAGGWRIGAARLPANGAGRELRRRLLGVASEIWSSPSAPVQHAAAYAFGEPPEIVERVGRSRRLHGLVTRAVAGRFAAAGARLATPGGAFYVYADFEDLREHLAVAHEVVTGADLARLLLDKYGVGVLAGSAFGDADRALRLRVATSRLYGETDEEQEAALAADDPLALPWIGSALARIDEVLADLTAKSEVAVPA